MKVLIAYDGSESADAGIDGLHRAGLPTEDVEALVVSVAEVWLSPPPGDEILDDPFPLQIPAGVKLARERATRIVEQAEAMAERGGMRVRRVFPRWTVSHEAMSGSPAFELLNRAGEWQPELIVTGSHGHTALGRFVLGSVSQKVLTEAQTSVRIARRATGAGESAERVVVGIDGSTGAQAAVRAVAARGWSAGSEVRVVVAQDLMKAFPVSLLIPPVNESVDEMNETERTRAEEIAAEAVKELRAGLDDKRVTVSSVIDAGDPKQVLVRHAEEFGADCIFTGATGFSNRIERLVLGSVSAAVAARAYCSVEVVRVPKRVQAD
jgi:nucleotide-binding universal stress UspA family protein